MAQKYSDERIQFVIGDVRDSESIDRALKGVHFVFHAAALKQVPACEFHPMEAFRTNVIGTDNTVSAAIKNCVERFVLLSTDKAVYPVNAMGMSKAMAEKTVASRGRLLSQHDSILCATRYGNVLASRGSVIPLFIQQIRAGVPLTVTDPTMTRFLMSLDQAVDLVFYAFTHACQGDIFVQKAPAATIGELAVAITELFHAENEIQIIGTRHGEKKYETLISREELARGIDLGDYFKIPCDRPSAAYDQYFVEGEPKLATVADYNSHNTKRLNIKEIKDMLLKLDLIRQHLTEVNQQYDKTPRHRVSRLHR